MSGNRCHLTFGGGHSTRVRTTSITVFNNHDHSLFLSRETSSPHFRLSGVRVLSLHLSLTSPTQPSFYLFQYIYIASIHLFFAGLFSYFSFHFRSRSDCFRHMSKHLGPFSLVLTTIDAKTINTSYTHCIDIATKRNSLSFRKARRESTPLPMFISDLISRGVVVNFQRLCFKKKLPPPAEINIGPF